AVAFSPDGKTLAAAYAAGDRPLVGGVVLWDAQARKRLQAKSLPVAEGPVRSVAFSPDGKFVAAFYELYPDRDDGGVVLWDAQGRTRLQAAPLRVAEGDVRGVAFSPDGKTFAAPSIHSPRCGVVRWGVRVR